MSHTWKSKIATGILGAALSLGVAFVAPSASAAVILVFGQTGTVNTVTGVAGATSTTISGTDVGIVITAIEGGPVALAFLDFTMTSTDQAVCELHPGCDGTSDVTQHYSGSFSINSLANNTGIDYLSGTFIDTLLGHGGGLTFTATTPPGANVVFTVGAGSTITTLGEDRAIAFSFTNVTPPISGTALCGGAGTATLCGFTSSVAGNMSAGIPRQTPEPATVALLGLALAGLGFSRRKQK